MDKALFDELLQSVEEMDLIARGEAAPARKTSFPDPDVQAIREQSGLTQSRFARAIGVSRRTLENWEQKRRQPTGPAKALLRLVEADPRATLHGLLLRK